LNPPRAPRELRKELGLFDVYAISTGAMFSSGFFLLPGLAAAQTGPSVALAYLAAGVIIMPAMFSVAELATAMPRAGGVYYFLDRSMGPLVGTVGGLGTWLALVLKSAFALIGMGAYLAIYVDVPIKPLAVALTVVFAVVNVVGAKETSGLQRLLVGILLAAVAFFIVQGLAEVSSRGMVEVARTRFVPFMPFGLTGFLSTVGFVFVSYAGLTHLASVSEEVRDPERNIPLGMILSLATAMVVYTVGVGLVVAVLPPDELRGDLTPLATASRAFFHWLPGGLGVMLMVAAAIAAFASTGNAGILAASRYPLAMARDRLVSPAFARVGRFRTPTIAIMTTAAVMIASIILFDVEGIAKLASAFQLLLFSLLNLAVVIMRESRIEGYDPGYRSPFYPLMQVLGFLIPLWLIAEMGHMAILFTLGMVFLTLGWYFHYARPRIDRGGAILHTFARLGELRHGGLELELRDIAAEKGLRAADPYDEVVARATVIECQPISLPELIDRAAADLARTTGADAQALSDRFNDEVASGFMPVSRGIALPHVRLPGLERPAMLLARCIRGIRRTRPRARGEGELIGAIFLVSRTEEPGEHLRFLGHLARHVDDPDFASTWSVAKGPAELKATLMREERVVTLRIEHGRATADLLGQALRSVDLPTDTLVTLVRRRGREIVPHGATVFEEGDQLTVFGTPQGIQELMRRYPHHDDRTPERLTAASGPPPDR
jgi:basic amino acid/polyamine antiporter, APA family